MNYDPSKDFQEEEQMFFEPCSKPRLHYLRLPEDVNYAFIESEEDIDKLNNLLNQPYIGVDAEWRPNINAWHKTKGVALF